MTRVTAPSCLVRFREDPSTPGDPTSATSIPCILRAGKETCKAVYRRESDQQSHPPFTPPPHARQRKRSVQVGSQTPEQSRGAACSPRAHWAFRLRGARDVPLLAAFKTRRPLGPPAEARERPPPRPRQGVRAPRPPPRAGPPQGVRAPRPPGHAPCP